MKAPNEEVYDMSGDEMAAGAAARPRLTARELAIWRSLLDTTAELRRVLGVKLQESGLSPADYQVLLALREADGARLRSSELAATIEWERSRLSHHLGRMERRGATDAVEEAGIVVLAIPLHKFTTLDPSLLDGKLVVDAMNYWPPVDGVQEMFEDHRYGSSEIVQRRLVRSTVVKTLNHIGYHELEDERRPRGSTERRALGVAGDDPGAVDVVAKFIERIGYDAVRFDRLSAGGLLEPGGPVFGASLHRTEFELA